MLKYILAEKTVGGNDGPERRLESECLRLMGLPLSAVRRTPPDGLAELVQRRGKFIVRSVTLAELLLLDAGLNDKAGDLRAATVSRLQAFCLIAESIQGLAGEEQAQYRAKLDELGKELRSVSDDPYLRGKIAEYGAKAS